MTFDAGECIMFDMQGKKIMSINFHNGFCIVFFKSYFLWNKYVRTMVYGNHRRQWMRDYGNRLKHYWKDGRQVYSGNKF